MLATLAAAQMTPRDMILEPSAEIAGGTLALSELADTPESQGFRPHLPIESLFGVVKHNWLEPGHQDSVKWAICRMRSKTKKRALGVTDRSRTCPRFGATELPVRSGDNGNDF
ncbi:MAG TPA: hypothetical protein DEO85_02625 [Maritimibacter sp.]|nr:hypothetical protein [Maritimibacter sp.]